jgi:signal transduction histidine kinase
MLPPWFLPQPRCYGFDPGQSSGLGMRLVNGMVQRLQGELNVSNTGQGARFAITMPVRTPAPAS